MKHLILILLLFLPLPAFAFSGKVTKISDGDTFTVQTSHGSQRVRIFGIDAPEHDQPGGTAAKKDLAALIMGKTVDVEPPPRHKKFPRSYDRIVAVVSGEGGDVALALLYLGDAWAYDAFDPPQSYDDAMAQAVAVKAGLWNAKEAYPPWYWRRMHKARP